MEADIKSFFNGIKQNTGIDFTVFNKRGEVVFGTALTGENVTFDFDGVFSDLGLSRTLFRFKLKNNEYIGRISGAGKAERTYATLISELARKSFIKTPELSRDDFLKSLLLSELSVQEINRYTRKYGLFIGPCCVMIINTPSNIGDVVNVVENYSTAGKDFCVILDSSSCAFVKFADETTNEYCSFTEYAEYIVQSVFDETALKVNVYTGGIVKNVTELGTSFQQACTAQRMAEAENSKGQVHSFKEYMLFKILEDLPRYKLSEYLQLLNDPGAEEMFSDAEMMATCEEFLENSLNQSETARKLYLHRNTLSYRLDKVEKITGLNIRKFPDAVSFRLITVLHKLVK